MTSDLNEELVAIRARAKQVGEELARSGFPESSWVTLAEASLLGAGLQAAERISERAALQWSVIAEGFAEGAADLGWGLAYTAHALLVPAAIAELGTADQRERYLPLMLEGAALGALSLSELAGPWAPPTLEAQRTAAGWALRGRLRFIVNGPASRLLLLTAVTSQRPTRLSTFIVDRADIVLDLRASSAGHLLGAAEMGQLEVARCELPAESLLGGEGQGEAARRLWTALDRSCGNGVIVGVMQHVVRAALAHASAQRRLGRSLATYQGARSTIAEMMLALRLTRLVSLHAARAWDGSTHRNEGTEKLFALEKLREVCMRGVELMGADTLDGARTADLARASALLCSALGGVELLRSAVAQPALDGSWREGEGA